MADITITGADGEFSTYIATPESRTGPGLVVIQEIFGVNHEMRRVVDKFAALGYVAVCPDLWFRMEPHIELTDKTKEEGENKEGHLRKIQSGRRLFITLQKSYLILL